VPAGRAVPRLVHDRRRTAASPGRPRRPPVLPAAQVISRQAASRCLSGPGAIVSVAQSLVLDKPVTAGNPASGPLGQRLVQNTPTGVIQAPLLIAQGLSDQLVLPSVQARYVRQRCAARQELDYLTYPGRDHVGLVAADSALDLLDPRPARRESCTRQLR
jgi:hypothetical protein